MPIAVLADIVRSRELPDRGRGQRVAEEVFARVERDLVAGATGETRQAAPLGAAVQPFRPTVGDEFQAVYADLGDALARVLLVRLALPAELDCRFGLGSGWIAPVPSGDRDDLQDGSAWWSARAAIEAAHALQSGVADGSRSWFLAAADDADPVLPRLAPLVNAYLLARDQLVAELSERARRSVYGWLAGHRQVDVARELGVSQSAVSQALRRGPAAALVAGWTALREGGMPWHSPASS
ncbi:SatD family protein [Microbacterium sp. X-17]|uniref:SatD family protein n=1 Tax=Microbacterium sp. X-17 TaxID=3144404 RepID=UPI0031F5D9E3